MKFLVSTFSGVGHVNPFSAVVTELAARGHSVLWLCGPRFRDQISATGAQFMYWTSPTCDVDVTPAIPDAETTGMAAGVSLARALFLDPMLGQVESYRHVLKDFAADALIVDLIGLGAMTLGELGGPVYVTIGTNPRILCDHADMPAAREADNDIPVCDFFGSPAFTKEFKPLVDESRARLGLDTLPNTFRLLECMTSPYLHLMQTTAAFEYADKVQQAHLRFVGPTKVLSNPNFVPPLWWSDLVKRDRFVVHVTQGTYTAQSTDSEALIMPTIRALKHEDCIVVATSPGSPFSEGKLSHAEGLPSNVRFEPFIPHAQLLPFVDVMITNAGYNGVTAALSYGVPMVCAGRSEDKADVSALVAYCGAGIDLKTDRPTEESIRDAVRMIRNHARYTTEAKRIQEDFKSHDSAVESCDLIEALVEQNRSIPKQ
ncbi:hypothetical protein MMC28_004827 [Mycoblastus sanguinarius]|nr:hypothetical protein [Mycoblastus sanguinarius]